MLFICTGGFNKTNYFMRITILVFLFSYFNASAQKTILYLNGKEKKIESYSMNNERLVFVPIDALDKKKSVDMYKVFSVKDSLTDKEIIIYNPDTSEGDLTREEMRMFIDGEQYAVKNYKDKTHKVAAAAIGIGSGIFTFYGLIIPATYAVIGGRFSPAVPMNLPNPPQSINEEMFKYGYQYKARAKKTKDNLIFGGIGFAVGFTAFAVILHNVK